MKLSRRSPCGPLWAFAQPACAPEPVIPTKVGIHAVVPPWIPAFAGMTKRWFHASRIAPSAMDH